LKIWLHTVQEDNCYKTARASDYIHVMEPTFQSHPHSLLEMDYLFSKILHVPALVPQYYLIKFRTF
jgi:hypothetical protein